MKRNESIHENLGGLYGILDLRPETGPRLVELAEQLLAGGTRVLQLRAKASSARETLDAARKLRSRTADAGALFIVNDRVDIALAAEADGVHLGQSDLPPARVREIAPASLLIGLSTHDPSQVAAAGTLDVDYIGFGPIFPTATKADAEAEQGIATLATITASTRLPVVAIGGLEECHAPELAAAGATAMAMIGAIERSADPATLARRIRGEFTRS